MLQLNFGRWDLSSSESGKSPCERRLERTEGFIHPARCFDVNAKLRQAGLEAGQLRQGQRGPEGQLRGRQVDFLWGVWERDLPQGGGRGGGCRGAAGASGLGDSLIKFQGHFMSKMLSPSSFCCILSSNPFYVWLFLWLLLNCWCNLTFDQTSLEGLIKLFWILVN